MKFYMLRNKNSTWYVRGRIASSGKIRFSISDRVKGCKKKIPSKKILNMYLYHHVADDYPTRLCAARKANIKLIYEDVN